MNNNGASASTPPAQKPAHMQASDFALAYVSAEMRGSTYNCGVCEKAFTIDRDGAFWIFRIERWLPICLRCHDQYARTFCDMVWVSDYAAHIFTRLQSMKLEPLKAQASDEQQNPNS